MPTLVLQPSESTSQDTYIRNALPGGNFGNDPYLTTGSDVAPGIYRSLLKFDLSDLPSGAIITSATLTLNVVFGTNPHGVVLRRSLVEWFEGTGVDFGDRSTWNHRNANGSVGWNGGAGGLSGFDFAISSGDPVTTVSGPGAYNWTVTTVVQNWFSGSQPNHGWWVINQGEGTANSAKSFASSSYSITSQRPRLTIVYEGADPPPPPPPPPPLNAPIGNVTAFIQLPDSSILAGTGPAGIFRSTDDGKTWVHLHDFASGSLSFVHQFTRLSGGSIFAAVHGNLATRGIWRSNNNGETWVRVKTLPVWNTVSPGGTPFQGYTGIASHGNTIVAVAETLLTASGMWRSRSADGGSTWHDINVQPQNRSGFSSLAFSPFPGSFNYFYYVTRGPVTLPAYVFNEITTGANTTPPSAPLDSQHPGGTGPSKIISFGVTDGSGRQRKMVLFLSDREVWSAEPLATGGLPFRKISDLPLGQWADTLYADTSSDSFPTGRRLFASTTNPHRILFSDDLGFTWNVLANLSGSGNVRAIIRTSADTLLGGGFNTIYRFEGVGSPPGGGDPDPGGDDPPGGDPPPPDPDPPPPDPDPPPPDPGPSPGGPGGGQVGPIVVNTASLGREATTTGLVPVSNKRAIFNITHIFNYNDSSGELTPLQFATNPPYTLFGEEPEIGQNVYFGSRNDEDSVPGGQFSSLVFNITQGALGLELLWEYWDGTGWKPLTVTDNTNQFTQVGENTVHWTIPSDWEEVVLTSVPGYWVRVRITGIDPEIDPIPPMPPVHSTRFIYTVNLPYIEIGASRISGTLPALGRITWRNLADNPGGNPALELDRLVVGLRSYPRGNNFHAYMNITDVRPPFGVEVVPRFTSGGGFVDHPQAPSGRAYEIFHENMNTLFSWNNVAEITLDTTVARDYYGTYRAFLRCFVANNGTATTWRYRLMVSFGSGGGTTFTKEFFAAPVNTEFLALDLGRVAVPNASIFSIGDNIGDRLSIMVQAYATAADVVSRVYDLVLIPADEWIADAQLSNILDNTIPNKLRGGDTLDMDSIGNPKSYLSTYVRQQSGLIKSIYQSISNGPIVMQTATRQRFWFFGMLYHYAGRAWTAHPSIAGAVRVNRLQRYSGFRGKR